MKIDEKISLLKKIIQEIKNISENLDNDNISEKKIDELHKELSGLKKGIRESVEELEEFLRKKMPDLEVNIFNQKLKLSYEENEKQRLLKAVETLNNNWNKFSYLHGKVSDLKIATLISLELQDTLGDIQDLKDKLNIKDNDNELLKKKLS